MSQFDLTDDQLQIQEMATKFTACATQVLPAAQAADVLTQLRLIDAVADVRALTSLFAT